MSKTFLSFSIILCILMLAFTTLKDTTITGKITDEAGTPVSGATIAVKGTGITTSSSQNGSFSIVVPANKNVLVVSYVGFDTKEIRITRDGEIRIALRRAKVSLQEVVVTGYGVQRKQSIVGNITTSRDYLAAAPYYDQASGSQINTQLGRIQEERMPIHGNSNGHTQEFNREGYDRIIENRFLTTTDNPLSTFSIDVDAASYSNVRRMLNNNQLPPAGAVRIEEFVNYFTYNYSQPSQVNPFSINTEIATCPWNEDHKLVSIGLQGRKISSNNLPASNLIFLIDVSGSMEVENKLPLVKSSLKMLAAQLREQDKVSIVVYAGNAGLVLKPTPGSDKQAIYEAVERLQAGGSTAGGQGIQLAYKTAKENFIKGGNNRVILCTDGDFNVGVSSDDELERMIEEERKSGVFLTVLGYGTGNYQDAKMQKLANKGNGNHAYIDQVSEAKKVLVNEFGGTLFTIAKDVKLQVEFNPAKVQGYRLLGYENRMLAKEDFNNDRKDAGELGSGHTVTALYEIIPVGVKSNEFDKIDELRYQKLPKKNEEITFNGELLNIKLRYKQPDGGVSKLLNHPVTDRNVSITNASDNLRFAAAVAQFGMLLRNSAYKYNSSYNQVEQLASSALKDDKEGYRKEFIELVRKAKKLTNDLAVIEAEE